MSKVLYLPGCSFHDRENETATKVYEYLQTIYNNQVDYYTLCCGAISEPYDFKDNLQKVDNEFIKKAKEYDIIIINCANCYDYYKRNINDDDTQSKITSIYEVIVDNYNFNVDYNKEKVSIHDPCPVRVYDNIHEAIRILLNKMNFEIHEVKYSRRLTKCCGNGGLVGFSNYRMKRKFKKEREQEFEYPIITYCSDCTRTLENSKHILRLLFKGERNNEKAY